MEYRFSGESIMFLDENKLNNSRSWYQENKSRYQEHLQKPFIRLVNDLSPEMLKIDEYFETSPTIGKTLSRIHRDTRFSKDKSLYRDSMWLTFRTSMKNVHDYPSFYFELNPREYSYGMGFFCPGAPVMNAFRAAIDANEDKFIKIIKKLEKNTTFTPDGEKYVRSKYTGSNEIVREWYDRKSIYVHCSSPKVIEAFDYEKLRDTLISEFAKLSDLYRFMKESQMYYMNV